VGCHNRLAKAYLELSKYRDARASLKAALAIEPNNRVATRQMARLPIRQLFVVVRETRRSPEQA